MRYKTDKPRWYAVEHPDLGVIVVECRDISTPWKVTVADSEKQLKAELEAKGLKWPEEQRSSVS